MSLYSIKDEMSEMNKEELSLLIGSLGLEIPRPYKNRRTVTEDLIALAFKEGKLDELISLIEERNNDRSTGEQK